MSYDDDEEDDVKVVDCSTKQIKGFVLKTCFVKKA